MGTAASEPCESVHEELGHRAERGSTTLESPLPERLRGLLESFDRTETGLSEALALLGLQNFDNLDNFVPVSELQPATQHLIDRLGCRHPATLQRVSAVYASVAGREGPVQNCL